MGVNSFVIRTDTYSKADGIGKDNDNNQDRILGHIRIFTDISRTVSAKDNLIKI